MTLDRKQARNHRDGPGPCQSIQHGSRTVESGALDFPGGTLVSTALPRIVLASGSPHRRALLERLRLPFGIESPDVDETPQPGETGTDLAARLALAKARAVAARHPDEALLVIGSDQVAELDATLFGKPGDRRTNIEQLRMSSGRSLDFHTGLALVDTATGVERIHVEPFRVRFRTLDDALIEAYVDAEQPFDAAGGFHCEGLGIVLFEALEGRDPNSLVGLPLIALVDALAGFGVRLPVRD
jgi:MAF protein